MTTDAPPDSPATAKAVRDVDQTYVFHPWSVQSQASQLAVAGAQGCYFWDYDGKRYLDFSSQSVNVNIGHQHPHVVGAIQRQAASLCTFAPGAAIDVRSRAAQLIAEHTPGDLNKIFFTNGGAEAVENAVRMARLHTGRHKVLSAYRSYHGSEQPRSISQLTRGAGRQTPDPLASPISVALTDTASNSTPRPTSRNVNEPYAILNRSSHSKVPG